MIQAINYVVTRGMDILLYPFRSLSPFWGLFFLSVLMSVLVLYIYKWVSSPKLIKTTKNRIKAHILAIRLYKDLWKVILTSFVKSLYYTAKYFLLNIGPVLIILPILFPLFVQMDIRYGMKPFNVGQSIVVKAKFNTGIEGKNIELLGDTHYGVVMKPVFIRALNEVNWKLEAKQGGVSAIKIRVDGNIYEKELVIGSRLEAMSNRRMQESSVGHFMYPVEKLLPKDGVLESIAVHYPGREIVFLGITAHWLVFNIILVVIIVLAFRKRFGVEF